MKTMAERSDLLATSFSTTRPDTGQTVTAVVVYDSHPGGIGFASKCSDYAAELPEDALELIRGCPCQEGCPACVGDFSINKHGIAWAIANLFQRSAPPPGLRVYQRPPQTPVAYAPAAPKVPWDEVVTRWPQISSMLARTGQFGTELLADIKRVEVRGAKLVLHVHSPGLARWIASDAVRTPLRNILRVHVETPKGWRLAAEVSQELAEVAHRRQHKLRRRLEDMHADDPHTERGANDRLGSGFFLSPEDRVERSGRHQDPFPAPGDGSVN